MQGSLGELFRRKSKVKSNFISLVLPLYNEQESLGILLDELCKYLSKNHSKYLFEITFVDDYSTDSSYSIIKNYSDSTPNNIRLSVVQLSKNSGSHIAITAGLNISRGDFVIVLASDGQDPMEVISTLINEWKKGAELVLAARSDNLDHGAISKLLSKMAWKIMKWSTGLEMPKLGCDLFGVDRKVINAYNKLNERNTAFLFRLLSLGFKQKEIVYLKRERIGGKSKWTLFKKIAVLMNAITSFSNRPLKLISKFGLTLFVILVFRWLYVIYKVYFIGIEPSEFNLIINTIYTALAIQVLIIGFIGDYIWRVLDETRKRPEYEVRKVDGEIFDEDSISGI